MLINQFSEQFSAILDALPNTIRREIERYADRTQNFQNKVSEIRLRAERPASLTIEGKNQILPVICTHTELSLVVKNFCGGSLYAHSETLKAGYISLAGGYRVGVAGRAVLENGKIVGVSDIYSVNVRVPHSLKGVGEYAYKILSELRFCSGMLIYSRPGVGKTTLLRDVAHRLSSYGGKRVALVDTRGELDSTFLKKGCMIDLLSGYPKGQGIEIATRTLSPEFIICDEIGTLEEARAILDVQSSGVPLVASAHAEDLDELLRRPAFSLLHRNRVFGAYLGIDRQGGETEYRYKFSSYEETERVKNETDLP